MDRSFDPTACLAAFASAFSQHSRLLNLRLGEDGSWNEALLPLEAHGEEALSSAFRYRVTCLSPEAAIELKGLLGLSARLALRDASGADVVRCGVVTRAEALGSNGGFARYALTIEPPFALLRHRRTSRVFQDRSVPDIVRAIFDEHAGANTVFLRGQSLVFQLAAPQPARSYCLQYRESDHDFIVRLLAEAGLAWRFEHVDGDVPQVRLIVFDDPFTLPPATQGMIRFHRADATESEDSLTEWSTSRNLGTRRVALATFDYKPVFTHHAVAATAVDQGPGAAAQASLEDYDPQTLYYAADDAALARDARLRQQAHDACRKRFLGAGSVRALRAGEWFRLAGHPAHDGRALAEREFAVTTLRFEARNNLPGELEALLPHRPPSEGPVPPLFRISLEAQRRGQPLPPPYAHTALAKPTARGAQTATVVGPPGEEVHTDELGRIKVQFHWQRRTEHPARGADLDDASSCWLRVVMPSAGAAWGHQFLPRVGQEVLVDYLEGDIDRPVVTGVLYNGAHRPPLFSGAGSLPANKALSGIQSREHRGRQYGELLFDDSPGQVRTKLSSEHAKTQLNLGFLTHPRSEGRATPRGEGAELRTDASMALRAARGLLLTTYGRLQARGDQLAREEAIELLDRCAELFKALGEYAGQHQALPADASTQEALIADIKRWEQGSNTNPKAQGGGRPVMAIAAEAGLSYATPQGIVGYAGLNCDITAGRHLQWTAGQRFTLNAGEGISQFAQSGDFRLIAHRGEFLIQAQGSDVVAQADKNIRLMATEGEVVLMAPAIRLVSQDGSFIRLDGNITLGTQGVLKIHAASKSMTGPATDKATLPAFRSGSADQKFQLHYAGARADEIQVAALREYEITLQDGSKITGTSDAEGRTSLLEKAAMQIADIRILPKKA